MDVTDCHNYWQHPYFPGRPWDPVDWIVRNVPMAGAPDGGTLRMLLTRAAGKPLVCTEYNHPAPNTYSSEAFLLLGAYAALHDLDGIFAFAYSHGDRLEPRHLREFLRHRRASDEDGRAACRGGALRARRRPDDRPADHRALHHGKLH